MNVITWEDARQSDPRIVSIMASPRLHRIRRFVHYAKIHISPRSCFADHRTLTLLTLESELRIESRGILQLRDVFTHVHPEQPFSSAALAACHLLSGLFIVSISSFSSILDSHSLCALRHNYTATCQLSCGPDEYAMVLRLFLETMFPWVDMLDSWLYEGLLCDPYDEFMIVQ